jgi:hypothetical protein
MWVPTLPFSLHRVSQRGRLVLNPEAKLYKQILLYKTRLYKPCASYQEKEFHKPEVVKVYSHIPDKPADPNLKKSIKANIETNLKYLKERFGEETTQLIIQGNEKAEELTSKLASIHSREKNPKPYIGLSSYYIIKGNVIH